MAKEKQSHYRRFKMNKESTLPDSVKKPVITVISMKFADAMSMTGNDIKHTVAILFPKRRKGLVVVVRSNIHLTLREKCRLDLPPLDLSKYDARLHSVDQLPVDHAITGYQGVLKPELLHLAERLALVSSKEKLNGGLFPGYPLPMESHYWTEFTENLPVHWAHVRLVRNTALDALLFAEGKVVKSIFLTNLLDGHFLSTRTEMIFESEVLFIDRTTNNGEEVLVVTDDSLYLLNLITKKVEGVKEHLEGEHGKITSYFKKHKHTVSSVEGKAIGLDPIYSPTGK
ncbi:MAG: hypothetical protein NUV61_01190 [Candidatus Azambacteria bacterium]|nr:hypothetical protein [Candidatus Azambacteria bacterium]